ncbi:hypothetical protein TNCV_2032871 [Trichonephila clavipes]|nr:hypothetical protein TNCV_2032871 [Trichonephila clavipes]
MNKSRKTLAGLDSPTVSSEECIAIDDDNVCTAPIMADKDILEFVQSSINIIDAGLGSRSPIGFKLLQGEWTNEPDLALLISGMRSNSNRNLTFVKVVILSDSKAAIQPIAFDATATSLHVLQCHANFICNSFGIRKSPLHPPVDSISLGYG